MAFLSDLSAKLGPLADKELAVLKALKADVEGGKPEDQVNACHRPEGAWVRCHARARK
jgi:hypothetical protein